MQVFCYFFDIFSSFCQLFLSKHNKMTKTKEAAVTAAPFALLSWEYVISQPLPCVR